MIVALAVLAVGLPTPKTETFTVDGVKRQALVFAPTNASRKPPLVFGFHGHGGTMNSSVNLFKVQQAWPDAVVVYPQGLPTSGPNDPQGLRSGWQRAPREQNDRDLKLFDAIVTKMTQQYSVDPKRIYSVGFSNGTGFTYLLWHTRRAQLAAAAMVAGIVENTIKPLKAMPAFIVAGKLDKTAPYDQQLDAIAYVKTVNGVPPIPSLVKVQQPTGVQRLRGKLADLGVMIHDGGHEVPTTAIAPIVQFFKHHPQP